MSSATNGRAREHRVSAYMTARGWHQIMRAAGSKGSADLLMASDEHGAALVQVGTRTKTLGPFERARFILDARRCSALALLAVCAQGQEPKFYQVTSDVPSRWARYSL